MRRKGGRPQRKLSELSPAIIHQKIDACNISNLSFDDIAKSLYSSSSDYRRYKFAPFRTKVNQILRNSPWPTNPPRNDAVEDTDDDDEETEEKSPEHRRKKQREMDDDDDEREIVHIRKRRKYDRIGLALTSSDYDSEASVSTSVDVEPEFDLMKNMLRVGYGCLKSESESKAKLGQKEKNLEVEDVRKEKGVASLMSRGDGEVVEEREYVKGLGGSSSGVVKGKEQGPRFKDLGGINAVVEKLKMEVMVPLCDPELPKCLRVKPIGGILLHGLPGCGKTKLANAIANEARVPFYQISATEVVSGVSGASEENIRDLFSKAYRTAPSIVFIDEIDAIASKRENLQRETDRRIVIQLLTCMDESHRLVQSNDKNSDSEAAHERSGYVLVIGATNRPDAIDPALRRPGRFDREISLGVPDVNARLEILSVLTQNLKLAGDFDMMKIAKATPGFVGADLAALANKAGNLAMKRIIDERRLEMSKEGGEHEEEWWRVRSSPEEREKLSITMSDFEEAAKMVQPSLRREGFSAIPDVKWDDVGGLDELRREFERLVMRPIKYPKLCEDSGMDMKTGFLLYGPPGCGKTLIAKAVANEAGANFIHIKGPELLNKYVGESELHVRTIFSRARTCAPCILFFDEVDALTTKSGEEGGGVVERLLKQLLIELDGADKRRGVYVIGATNRPEVMDKALLRPGRFGRLLYVPLPSPDERGLILRALARKKPIDASVDLLALGKSPSCDGLSGADLAALVHEAAMIAMDEHIAAFQDKMESEESFSDSTPFIIKSTHFEQALRKISPSVSAEQKQHYEVLSKVLSTCLRTG